MFVPLKNSNFRGCVGVWVCVYVCMCAHACMLYFFVVAFLKGSANFEDVHFFFDIFVLDIHPVYEICKESGRNQVGTSCFQDGSRRHTN